MNLQRFPGFSGERKERLDLARNSKGVTGYSSDIPSYGRDILGACVISRKPTLKFDRDYRGG